VFIHFILADFQTAAEVFNAVHAGCSALDFCLDNSETVLNCVGCAGRVRFKGVFACRLVRTG
jgi:hypothetical protein